MARSMAASGSSRRRACDARRFRTKLISRAFEHLLRLPELGVLDRLDPVPGLGVPLALGPVGPQVAVEEQVHLRGDPALARERRW